MHGRVSVDVLRVDVTTEVDELLDCLNTKAVVNSDHEWGLPFFTDVIWTQGSFFQELYQFAFIFSFGNLIVQIKDDLLINFQVFDILRVVRLDWH